jgi:hypothetical protein
MSLDTGDYEWIHFTPEIGLGEFEKIHSGASGDSYILRSTSNPRIHMGVKKEEFFRSLLNKRADEILTSARVFMATKDQERVEPDGSRIKGLPGNIDPTKPPKNFRDAMSITKNGLRHMKRQPCSCFAWLY